MQYGQLRFCALALMLVLPLAGCGDDDNDDGGFASCGNGVIDGSEECDDGNLLDTDDCLSTCEEATCGDGFLNAGEEECDGSNFGGATCSSLGLGSGSLACENDCEVDTTGCGGTGPTPTPAPVVATATPGETPTGGTVPTATPPGGGATCSSGDSLTVAISLNSQGAPMSGVAMALTYPSSVVIPGSNEDQSVKDRVTFVPQGGLTTVSDQDPNSDLIDDRLQISIVSGTPFNQGPFVEVELDCTDGAPVPAAGAFGCSVQSASDDVGNTITATCSLTVTGP